MASKSKRHVEVVSLVDSSSEEDQHDEDDEDDVTFETTSRKRRQPAKPPATKRARLVVFEEASSQEPSSQPGQTLSQSSSSPSDKKGKQGHRANIGPLTFISSQAAPSTKQTQKVHDETNTLPRPPLPTANRSVDTKKDTQKSTAAAGQGISRFTVKGHNMAEAAGTKAGEQARSTKRNTHAAGWSATGAGNVGQLLKSSQSSVITGFPSRTATTGQEPAAAEAAECWIDKHTPTRSDDLVVHKKKVSELQAWLSAWSTGTAVRQRLPKLMILSGPAGCGKSSTVHVLASELGMQVVEWSAPAPTLWQETLYQKQSYNSGEGSSYASKMDEFAAFVSRAKYPALLFGGKRGVAGSPSRPQLTQGISIEGPSSQPPGARKLLMCDDLPHAHDAQRRQHLATLLVDLATTSRCPVVLIVTETSGGGLAAAAGGRAGQTAALTDAGLHKDLQGMLQEAGAGVIAFNKLTDASISKALVRIAQAELCSLSKEAADSLAAAADGDIRNAIQSLELMFGRSSTSSHNTGQGNTGGPRKSSGPRGKKGTAAGSGKGGKGGGGRGGTGAGGAGKALLPHEAAALPAIQRDLGLALFHALGKILHNKRDAGVGTELDLVDKQINFDDEDLMISTATNNKIRTTKRPESFQVQRAQDGITHTSSSTSSKAGHKHDSSSIHIDLTDSQNEDDMTARHQHDTLDDSDDHVNDTNKPVLLRSIPSFADTEDLLQPSQRRPPMRYDPESIVSKSGLEAPTLISFLHANYTRFMSSHDMDQACAAAEYLSDATLLSKGPQGGMTAGGSSSMWSEEDGAAANLAAAAATSVAARGLLFAHQPHGSAGYVPLHSSNHSLVERAAVANMGSLKDVASRMALHRNNGAGPGSGLLLACQVLPYLRVLNAHPSYTWLNKAMPTCWSHFFNGQVTEQRSWHQQTSGTEVADLAMALEETGIEGEETENVQDDPIEDD